MKLVWHADNLMEVDWIRDILGDQVDGETVDLDLTCFDDNAVHIVSSNWRPLSDYHAYFSEIRSRCSRVVLFHASDEWYSGSYTLYKYFDGVIRNYHTYLANEPGILTIPLGYSNGTRIGAASLPVEQRKYAWSFTGELKASRLEMVEALDGLAPRLVTGTASISDKGGTKLSKPEFDAVLGDTVFSPCPMGNVVMETWRLYESLELGCIPLAEARVSLDYFTHLLGPNPIPTFRTWTDARRYAEAAFGDKAELAATQARIADWWTAHKARLRAEVRAFLTGPSHSAALTAYAGLARNRLPVVHEPLRLAELLRHQSGSSLKRRLARPGAPLKRIVRESLRRFSR